MKRQRQYGNNSFIVFSDKLCLLMSFKIYMYFVIDFMVTWKPIFKSLQAAKSLAKNCMELQSVSTSSIAGNMTAGLESAPQSRWLPLTTIL